MMELFCSQTSALVVEEAAVDANNEFINNLLIGLQLWQAGTIWRRLIFGLLACQPAAA